MDFMDRLRSGRSRSIKRLSISVSLKSLDSRAKIEKLLYSAGEQVLELNIWSNMAVVW